MAPPAAPVTPLVPAKPATPPVISLTKRALATTVPAGSTVRYQLTVTATGGTAQDVVVCDKLPSNMTYVSIGSATLVNGRACWDIGSLKGSKTLSMVVKVDVNAAAGTHTNNATVTSSNAGGDKAHATINVPKSQKGVKGKLKRAAGVTG